jgi:hypothetical protein
MVQQGNGPFLGLPPQTVRWAVVTDQLHQGGGDLLGAAAGLLGFECVPVTPLDRQQAVQGLSKLTASFRPGPDPCRGRVAIGGQQGGGVFRGKRHWTRGGKGLHPGAMPKRLPRSSRRRPPGWLHSLSSLLAVAARGERLQTDDTSCGARRLHQQLELGQRLLDPLPKPLRAGNGQEEWLWKALRWGGGGMVLAWLLNR